MRSTTYSDIISMFFMDNKPKRPFTPDDKGFKELVRYAMEMAFNDFNFRTLTKTEAFKKEYAGWEEYEKKIRKQQEKNERNPEPKMTLYLIERLDVCGFLDRFVDYFNATIRDQTAFDNWHNETCEMFLNILDGTESFVEYTKAYTGLAYGKAQKIVNMMFKHLYCLNGADAYQDYFKHCHMVLDNFTLEWFKREVGKKRIESWSNLIYKDPFVDHNDYMFYQDKIREYFAPTTSSEHSYIGLTPFQAEFFIWPEIQWILAAEGLLNQNLLDNVMRSGRNIAADTDIVSKCDTLMKQLAALRVLYINA